MMDKKRIELIAAVTLVIVFILLLSSSLRRIFRNLSLRRSEAVSAAYPPGTAGPGLPAGMPSGKGEALKEPEWGRDPFFLNEFGQGGVESPSSLRLMGITIGEKTKPMAIINNEIVSVGSRIGKFKIVSITAAKVVVTDGDKNYELRLGSQ